MEWDVPIGQCLQSAIRINVKLENDAVINGFKIGSG